MTREAPAMRAGFEKVVQIGNESRHLVRKSTTDEMRVFEDLSLRNPGLPHFPQRDLWAFGAISFDFRVNQASQPTSTLFSFCKWSYDWINARIHAFLRLRRTA